MSPRGRRNPATIFMSTTEIPAEQTAGEIQGLLGKSGAKRVMTEYEGGEIVAVSFTLIIQEKEVLFRLPVRWKNFAKVLDRAQHEKRTYKPVPTDQARRTAWRVALRWLEAQLALVASEMVDIQEVMLPYIVQGKGQETLYERLAQTGFLLEHK